MFSSKHASQRSNKKIHYLVIAYYYLIYAHTKLLFSINTSEQITWEIQNDNKIDKTKKTNNYKPKWCLLRLIDKLSDSSRGSSCSPASVLLSAPGNDSFVRFDGVFAHSRKGGLKRIIWFCGMGEFAGWLPGNWHDLTLRSNWASSTVSNVRFTDFLNSLYCGWEMKLWHTGCGLQAAM